MTIVDCMITKYIKSIYFDIKIICVNVILFLNHTFITGNNSSFIITSASAERGLLLDISLPEVCQDEHKQFLNFLYKRSEITKISKTKLVEVNFVILKLCKILFGSKSILMYKSWIVCLCA